MVMVMVLIVPRDVAVMVIVVATIVEGIVVAWW